MTPLDLILPKHYGIKMPEKEHRGGVWPCRRSTVGHQVKEGYAGERVRVLDNGEVLCGTDGHSFVSVNILDNMDEPHVSPFQGDRLRASWRASPWHTADYPPTILATIHLCIHQVRVIILNPWSKGLYSNSQPFGNPPNQLVRARGRINEHEIMRRLIRQRPFSHCLRVKSVHLWVAVPPPCELWRTSGSCDALILPSTRASTRS